MNLTYINKNILDVEEGIIVHQVNCRGVMRAGLALRIRQKWPQVYTEYMKWYTYGYSLGGVQLVQVDNKLYVANLFGQEYYGRTIGKCYTSYGAIEHGMKHLYFWSLQHEYQVYVPNGMGCRLGGGQWDLVEKIIDKCCPSAIICNYE